MSPPRSDLNGLSTTVEEMARAKVGAEIGTVIKFGKIVVVSVVALMGAGVTAHGYFLAWKSGVDRDLVENAKVHATAKTTSDDHEARLRAIERDIGDIRASTARIEAKLGK